MSRRIRVLLVDDSPTVLELLRSIIDADARLQVVAAVETAEEALRLLDQVQPDVISMDVRLPGMNGFDATQHIMALRPTPVVVVSTSIDAEELNISMNALRAGALTVLEKPVGRSHPQFAVMAERLCTQLAIMSEVRLVQQRGALRPSPGFAAAPVAPPGIGPIRMVGMVASTGGPQALATVLGGLPPDFAVPVLVVQHMSEAFLAGFVAWLDTQSRLRVQLAQAADCPLPGRVYVAPAAAHLRLDGSRLELSQAAEMEGQRPSGTVLFQSMATSLGGAGVGVLLTGMGVDGAAGLLLLRQAGGYTIAEDASTAVVYGMPEAAVHLGAACECQPLSQIAARLTQLVASRA